LVVETHATPESQAEANHDPAYQEQRAANDNAFEIGVATIVVGVLQTIALVITFLVIAYVAVRQLRAYITPSVERLVKFSLTDPIEIMVSFKNMGQTPAKEFEASGAVFFGTFPLDETKPVEGPAEPPSGIHSKCAVYPQAEQTITASTGGQRIPSPIPPEFIAELRKCPPKFAIYVSGLARYRDVFGFRREAELCYFITPEDTVKLLDTEGDYSGPINFAATHFYNGFK
jgi:hypothetical protein